jgi:hypothetical protein
MNRKTLNIAVFIIFLSSLIFELTSSFTDNRDLKILNDNISNTSQKIKLSDSSVRTTYEIDTTNQIIIEEGNTFQVNYNFYNPNNTDIVDLTIEEKDDSNYILNTTTAIDLQYGDSSYTYKIPLIKAKETVTIKSDYYIQKTDGFNRLIQGNPFTYVVIIFSIAYLLFIIINRILKLFKVKQLNSIIKDHIYLVMQLSFIYRFGLEFISLLLLRFGVKSNLTIFIVLLVFPILLYVLQKTLFSKSKYALTTYRNSVFVIFITILVVQLFTLTFDESNRDQLIAITQTMVGMNVYIRLSSIKKVEKEK